MSSHRLADMLDRADDLKTQMKEEGRWPPENLRKKEPCAKCGSIEYKARGYGIKPEMNWCDVCTPDWAQVLTFRR